MTRIRVVHRSGYEYDPWAMASHNEARMAPKNTPGQFVLSHKIQISPTAWQHAYTDYWGTSVLAFEVHEKHPRLSIMAISEVDVTRSSLSDEGHADIEWDDLTNMRLVDQFCEYLECTPETELEGALDAEVREVREASARPIDYVHAMQQLLAARVQATGRHADQSHARDALRTGRGSRRDTTNLLASALRSAGIPTRYVLGYYLSVPDPQVGQPVPGGSHSWIEYWNGRWEALDPVSGLVPDDYYVEIGHGRDHGDITPLTGIFTGVRTANTFVEITLTRLT